jgi:hypothetical protein
LFDLRHLAQSKSKILLNYAESVPIANGGRERALARGGGSGDAGPAWAVCHAVVLGHVTLISAVGAQAGIPKIAWEVRQRGRF